MKLAALALTLIIALSPAAHADDTGHSSKLKRRVGIGLLITSGALLVLGITFVVLAKTANDDALRNNTYDPSAEDRRNAFQVTHTAFFTGSAAAFTSGMVLFWDR